MAKAKVRRIFISVIFHHFDIIDKSCCFLLTYSLQPTGESFMTNNTFRFAKHYTPIRQKTLDSYKDMNTLHNEYGELIDECLFLSRLIENLKLLSCREKFLSIACTLIRFELPRFRPHGLSSHLWLWIKEHVVRYGYVPPKIIDNHSSNNSARIKMRSAIHPLINHKLNWQNHWRIFVQNQSLLYFFGSLDMINL